MIGLLFSGQGAQKTGLTLDLYQSVPQYRQLIDQASNILQFDLPDLLYDQAQAQRLAATEYAQPAILAVSYALNQVLQDSVDIPAFGIGLSLGEYSALVSAHNIDFVSALRLIQKRGELMGKAGKQHPGVMVAVMKSSLPKIKAVLATVQDLGEIGIANVNTPKQVVIGGAEKPVTKACSELTAQGARVVPLRVSGAFHTPLMQSIQSDLNAELRQVNWQKGRFPVYSTTTQTEFTPANLTTNLTNQLVSSTYFAKTLMQHQDKLTAVVELGPGQTLLSFARKVVAGVPTYRTDSCTDMQAAVSALEAMK